TNLVLLILFLLKVSSAAQSFRTYWIIFVIQIFVIIMQLRYY
ncbi:hypothetical protein PROFUN_16972, partial [Planoprotostelium fungivorum]